MCIKGRSENENRNKEWLVMESLSHEKFKTKDMTEKHLLNDLNQMTEQTHITLLEVLHASKIQYLLKSVF